MMRSFIPAVLALALLVALPGCLIGSTTETIYSGALVSDETLAHVQPGDSEASVVALLGDPTSRAAQAGGSQILKWEYTRETKSKGSVLFVLGTNKKSSSSGAVFVLIRDGKVEKTWRD